MAGNESRVQLPIPKCRNRGIHPTRIASLASVSILVKPPKPIISSPASPGARRSSSDHTRSGFDVSCVPTMKKKREVGKNEFYQSCVAQIELSQRNSRGQQHIQREGTARRARHVYMSQLDGVFKENGCDGAAHIQTLEPRKERKSAEREVNVRKGQRMQLIRRRHRVVLDHCAITHERDQIGKHQKQLAQLGLKGTTPRA